MKTKSKEHASAYVMRFSDQFLPIGTGTIQEHNVVFDTNGKVWLGKWGRPVAAHTLAYASTSADFYFILIRAFSGRRKRQASPGSIAFISRVCEATTRRPPDNLIPPYYRKSKDISAWFCLTEALQSIGRGELLSWVVRSSQKLVIDSMSSGTASFFIADRKPGKIISSVFVPTVADASDGGGREDVLGIADGLEDFAGAEDVAGSEGDYPDEVRAKDDY